MPAGYAGPVRVTAQDLTPVSNLGAAVRAGAVRRVPDVAYIADLNLADAARELPGWRLESFPLSGVPRGPTVPIILQRLRRECRGGGVLQVGCVGLDAYFGRSTRYAPSLGVPYPFRVHYVDVNEKIERAAALERVYLYDLCAELSPD